LIGTVLPSGCQHRPGGPAADHRGSAGCVGFIAKRSHVGGKRAATNRSKLAQDLVGGVTHGLAFIDNSPVDREIIEDDQIVLEQVRHVGGRAPVGKT
jgi:hypothetical protein